MIDDRRPTADSADAGSLLLMPIPSLLQYSTYFSAVPSARSMVLLSKYLFTVVRRQCAASAVCTSVLRYFRCDIRGTPAEEPSSANKAMFTPSQSSSAPAYSSSGSSPGIGCIQPSKYRKAFSGMVMVAHSGLVSEKVQCVVWVTMGVCQLPFKWPMGMCSFTPRQIRTSIQYSMYMYYTWYIEHHMHCNAVTVLCRSYSVLVGT